ncbi:MAG: CorA family divalent cation transporter [Candidatus Paceibacterota bacterium]|jgi:magnesium transporter|nr:CorA family divalent cation transporter [Candidatus Paceibacterota bacterium]MDD5555104.1 CorA family divalent cation transporter [Candidatus Paceibacterota bacterium]
MIEIYFKDIKKERLGKIKEVRDGCWINIKKAGPDDLRYVSRLTGLEMTDLDDALDPYELPRIEREGGNILVFLRAPQEEKEDIYTTLLTLIVTPRYFFTISYSQNAIIDATIKKGVDFSTTQRSKLLIYILLLISKNFTKEIKNIRSKVFYQKKSLEKVESLEIIDLIKNEEIINQYISALVPTRNVFEAIAGGGYIPLFSNDEDLLEDMIISIKQSADICLVNVKSIKSLRESYQVIFTNQVNKTIRFLTSFTIILTIPTIIASIYGMNVGLPFQENPLAFFYVLIFTFVTAAVFLLIFYVKKWL